MAWSDGRPSGVCALDGFGTVVDERWLVTDGEIVEWIAGLATERAVVAADIPLVVPNQTGSRVCDRAVASGYGGRGAGPHPANRQLFESRFGRVRGEDLLRRLGSLGFGLPGSGSGRTVLEAYPHPGLVEVFGLPDRLAYKKGSVSQRRRGLRRLRTLLDGLTDARPPLIGPHIVIAHNASGRELKAIEDRLDARFCAWTAAIWDDDRRRVRIFGDAYGAHIAVALR